MTDIVVDKKSLRSIVGFLLDREPRMFFIHCRWTPPDELYGITDPSTDSIGIHEVSTFNSQKKVIFLHFSPLAFFVCQKVLVLL
jgi:hypothetical protein